MKTTRLRRHHFITRSTRVMDRMMEMAVPVIQLPTQVILLKPSCGPILLVAVAKKVVVVVVAALLAVVANFILDLRAKIKLLNVRIKF